MQEYNCVVKAADGKITKKYKTKAIDEVALMKQLKSSGLYLVDYKKVEERKDIVGGNKIKLSLKDIAMFSRQLSAMLEAGVTLIKALNILYLQMEKKNVKESIKRLYENVQKGDQLSDALKKQEGVYPEIMISMVEAGEASGRLDSVIAKVADTFEKDVKLRNKIKSSMMYPIILAVLCVAVVLILVMKVLPVFMTMFTESMVLPLPTRILLAFSDILTGYWYIILLVIAAIVFGIRAYVSTEEGKRKWHSTLLKAPVLGKTITKIAAVRFTRTLGTLLSSGMTLIQSLEIVIKVVGNRIIMEGLETTKEDIRKGMPLSQSLRKADVLPPLVYSMIGIGEESGTIEDMLDKTSEYYDDEIDNSISKLVSLLEPILIVFMAFIVGFIIISILLPVFEIYQSVGA
ncbi:MAG: type II secretion system F family protein [Anaerovoracaceae bacterium]|jgi:type IV pilus assembly protein PilC